MLLVSCVYGNGSCLYRWELRPETVESYFYLWRITKDPKYREWGYEMLQQIERHCKKAHGYAGVKNVWSGGSMEVQNSWFLAEVLKYLFLLFSPDDVLPLDKFVMNTEAHPIPKVSARQAGGESTAWSPSAVGGLLAAH